MASPAALAFNRHVIPMISKFPENDEGSYTSLTRVVPLGGDNTEKRKYNVPIVSTSDVETLCRNILEFQDVSAGPMLSLTTGPLKFTYYHQTLRRTKRNKWDTIANTQPQTLAGFQAAIDAFVNESIRPTDLADEQHYLQMCRKPHRLTCATLSARIEYINKLLSVFPGAGGNPPFQALDLKNMYYRMMPDPWKWSFLNSGQMLTDPNYTLLDLQRYMSLQEDQQQMTQPRSSPRRAQGISRGGMRTPNSTRRRRSQGYQGGPPTHRTRYDSNDRVPQHQPPYYGYRNQQQPIPGQQAYPYCPQGYQPTSRPPPNAAQVSPGTRPPFRAPAQRGFGRGRGRGRAPEIYQTLNSSSMPPTVAAPTRPAGQPPEDLHHQDEEQVAAPFATWVSQDYNPGHNFAQEEDQEYHTEQEPEEYDYFDDDYYLGDENQQW